MVDQPENLVLQLLREMRGEMAEMRAESATKGDAHRLDDKIADVRSEIHSLRADVASDLLTVEKRLSDQIVGLRRAVVEYHSSAIGHGVLIGEFEERLRRVEQHLNLDSPDPH
jgi:phage shock protein A